MVFLLPKFSMTNLPPFCNGNTGQNYLSPNDHQFKTAQKFLTILLLKIRWPNICHCCNTIFRVKNTFHQYFATKILMAPFLIICHRFVNKYIVTKLVTKKFIIVIVKNKCHQNFATEILVASFLVICHWFFPENFGLQINLPPI